MGKRIWESVLFSLEWRLYAYVITVAFLYATTGELAFAAVQALGLQLVLLVCHTTWYYFRQEGSHGFTLDALATRLSRMILHSFSRGN
ncbi:MAG: hypothetical protein AAB955_00050 [Patescibacteria group bacterium]